MRIKAVAFPPFGEKKLVTFDNHNSKYFFLNLDFHTKNRRKRIRSKLGWDKNKY